MTVEYLTEIMNKPRTAGDGMESDETVSECLDSKKQSRKTSFTTTRLVQIYPTNIIKSEKRKSINTKTPKFVPYEPYAGAVKPMTPKIFSKSKKSRNNMDINTLITQMSQMNTNLNEFKPRQKVNSIGDKFTPEEDETSPEKQEMEKRLKELNQENDYLKEQLKQQVQVSPIDFHCKSILHKTIILYVCVCVEYLNL